MKMGLNRIKIHKPGERALFRTAVRLLPALCLLLFVSGCRREEGPRRHVERLASPSETVRESAIIELRRMSEEAAPLLREAFLEAGSDEEGERIVQGAAAVLREVPVIDTLQTAATRLTPEDEPRPGIRLAAIQTVAAVAFVQRRFATEHLRKVLDDPDIRCVNAAVRGLRDMHFAEATAVLEERFQEREGPASVLSARVLYETDMRDDAAAALFDAISDPDEEIRQTALESVVDLGSSYDVGPSLLSLLIERIKDHPEQEEALETAVEGIRDVLLERITRVLPPRRTRIVMEQLGMIADDAVLADLHTVVGNRDESTFKRVAAAEALGHAAAAEHRPVGADSSLRREVRDLLLNLIDDTDIDNRIRIAAAISLSRLQEERGISFLLSQLEELDTAEVAERRELIPLRVSAQEAMEASGDFVAPYLLDALKDPGVGDTTRWAAAYTLGRLEEREVIPMLIELLTAATEVAELAGAGEEDEVVVETADSRTLTIKVNRYAVLKATIGDDARFPQYGPEVRIAAAKGLGRFGDEDSISALSESLELHEEISEKLNDFLARRMYTDMAPAAIADDDLRTHLRNRLHDTARALTSEIENVIFYINRALSDVEETETDTLTHASPESGSDTRKETD